MVTRSDTVVTVMCYATRLFFTLHTWHDAQNSRCSVYHYLYFYLYIFHLIKLPMINVDLRLSSC